ncbi:MAG: RNA polymerase factor sigma-32 [Myxococcota bacterium]
MDQAPPRDPALVPQDPISRYLAEIRPHPLLSRDEERELGIRVFDHDDREAAERLVLGNLRLVVKIARDYRRVWTNLLDLIQEGNVGLVQAVRRYDPYRGVKFSSYAAYWIRAYILKYLIDNIRMVRIGGSRAERKLFFRLNRVKRELEQAGFRPEPKLLAEKLEVREKDIVDFEQRLEESELSLDAPASSSEPGGASLGDMIASSVESVEREVSRENLRQTLHKYIDRFAVELDERETRILRERILAESPKTLQEMGDEFGLTRERVRQVEARMVSRLREFLKENLVDFDYWAPEE